VKRQAWSGPRPISESNGGGITIGSSRTENHAPSVWSLGMTSENVRSLALVRAFSSKESQARKAKQVVAATKELLGLPLFFGGLWLPNVGAEHLIQPFNLQRAPGLFVDIDDHAV
jgi:hypothetical protein